MIAWVVSAVLLLGAAILAVPVAVFFCECVLGAGWKERRATATRPAGSRAVILIPAHNEEEGIRITLERLQPELSPDDTVLVIADNCTDQTANVARALGAEVAERSHDTDRGKGFALAFGAERIAALPTPPDVVIVLDSDCRFTPGSVDALVADCLTRGFPMQGDDELVCPKEAGTKAKISTFAFRVKNTLRSRGLDRLGMPRQLAGTGMAFPWPTFRDAPNTRGWITEDLVLGLELTLRRSPVYLCSRARVESDVAPSTQGHTKQRQRWEHGHLSALKQYVPKLLWGAFRQRRISPLAIALDLSVPPLALLTAMVLGLAGVAGLTAMLGLGALPALVMASQVLALFVAVGLAWAKLGRDLLTLGDLLRIPLYMLGKLSSYFRWFGGKGDKKWVRAERPDEEKNEEKK